MRSAIEIVRAYEMLVLASDSAQDPLLGAAAMALGWVCEIDQPDNPMPQLIEQARQIVKDEGGRN